MRILLRISSPMFLQGNEERNIKVPGRILRLGPVVVGAEAADGDVFIVVAASDADIAVVIYG